MMRAIAVSQPRRFLARALIWSLIGVIYAPLLVALHHLFVALGGGAWAYVPAAALAAGASAMLYDARQLAIVASVVGVTAASLPLMMLGPITPLWQVAALALGIGIVLGFAARFPSQCTQNIGGKVMAAMTGGALCGVVLAGAEMFSGFEFTPSAAMAFLVSVNGVLYVATVRFWVARLGCAQRTARGWKQALVIGTIALITAASVWIIAGAVSTSGADALTLALLAVPGNIPPALSIAAVAGVITGLLLEGFGFRWVHDV